MTEMIKDHLFLGSLDDAIHLTWLKQKGIRHVISIISDDMHNATQLLQNNHILHTSFFVVDMNYENILSIFPQVNDIIQQNVPTLVHCRHGISRSASCIIAFLMFACHMHVDEAMQFVSKRRTMCPNDGFVSQLFQYETMLFGTPRFTSDADGFKVCKKILHEPPICFTQTYKQT